MIRPMTARLATRPAKVLKTALEGAVGAPEGEGAVGAPAAEGTAGAPGGRAGRPRKARRQR
jgi:hypothetical protein